MVMSNTWGSGIDKRKYCAVGNCIVKWVLKELVKEGDGLMKGVGWTGFMYSFSHLSNAKCSYIHTIMIGLTLIQRQDGTQPGMKDDF